MKPRHDIEGNSLATSSKLPRLRTMQPAMNVPETHTLYMPIASPPTPAPSPGPIINPSYPYESAPISGGGGAQLVRRQFLTTILASCTPEELLFISATIAPRLKRDFLVSLPAELALYILSFIDDPRTLARASQVSRYWRSLVQEQSVWKRMCEVHGYSPSWEPGFATHTHVDAKGKRRADTTAFSYLVHFRNSYITMTNWRKGGHLLRSHRIPMVTPESGVVTSLALDADWVAIGLENSKVHVYSATTGVLARTLVGHEMGVWSVCLVSKGGWRAPEPSPTNDRTSEDDKPFNPARSRRRVPFGAESSLSPSRRALRNKLARLSLDNAPLSELVEYLTPPHGVDSLPKSDEDNHGDPSRHIPESLRVALGLGAHQDPEGIDRAPKEHLYSPQRVVDEDALEGEYPSPSGVPQPGEELPPKAHFPQAKRKYSDMCNSSQGWGQPNTIIVSGGCDKTVIVWDAVTGQRIYRLVGHTSTIRCIRVLQNRPIAISGSRDATLRVWDIQRGTCLRVLEGHQQSVRCIDTCGNRVVSGSYDTTCRVWDVDTGECLHVLTGHFHQLYSVAFNGRFIASGGLDTTVRLWDADTGECIALLQGHTALVCQLQLSPDLLITGGSDGRVITFSLETLSISHRIAAHDCSVTSLQFVDDGGERDNFLVTGGNDGRVRLYEVQSGNYVREVSEGGESVWKVVAGWGTCVVVCKRGGKTVVELWSMRPGSS